MARSTGVHNQKKLHLTKQTFDVCNISKRVGEGVATICVVLDQSTVIFQKGVLQCVWY